MLELMGRFFPVEEEVYFMKNVTTGSIFFSTAKRTGRELNVARTGYT